VTTHVREKRHRLERECSTREEKVGGTQTALRLNRQVPANVAVESSAPEQGTRRYYPLSSLAQLQQLTRFLQSQQPQPSPQSPFSVSPDAAPQLRQRGMDSASHSDAVSPSSAQVGRLNPFERIFSSATEQWSQITNVSAM
jgi:hypothetical protein